MSLQNGTSREFQVLHEMLVEICGVAAVSKQCVFGWFKHYFIDGKEEVNDETRSGRPSTSTTPDNIKRFRWILASARLQACAVQTGQKISLLKIFVNNRAYTA